MLPLAAQVPVYLVCGPTDMRKAINGLSVYVAEALDTDPFAGALFVFCNRRQDLIKVLYWDRNGFCLWQKRLQQDRFVWPQEAAQVKQLSSRQLAWLLEGLDPMAHKGHPSRNYSVLF